jgi:hypothetical protein
MVKAQVEAEDIQRTAGFTITNQPSAMTLVIDDKRIEEPDGAAIANAFESLDKKTTLREGGVSLIELSRSKGNSLAVSGHPVEGWLGLVHEVSGVTSAADISAPLQQEKIVQMFQSYARGDNSWGKEFEWEVIDSGRWPVKRIALLIGIAAILVFVGHSCLK